MRGTFGLEHPIGRDAELALADKLIHATLADARSGEPRVRAVLVGGEAGIGKTTFVNAVGRLATAGGLGFTIGHCLDLATECRSVRSWRPFARTSANLQETSHRA
jgi:predicted ATPase